MYEIMDNKKINQYANLKDVVASIRNGKVFNLPGLLEMLNTITEDDVQVKLFSALSAYIMLNNDNIEAIVTYNPIYDKICEILANCPPRKTTVALNFLSALLYVDDECCQRKNSLIAYAKNMIRSSGCLATMCDLFTTCMMQQDAWRALCRCLAESCRNIEANQSYCTHLVPMCVMRCSQRNIEVLLVLQSLLQNHTRNITLFLECNGISLFQRDFLQHNPCLQLLATIVQSSSEAGELIAKTGVCQKLRDFLQMYGPQSQLGQWATVVLFHTSKFEAPREVADLIKKGVNKFSESFLAKLHPADENLQKESSANTTQFFQNVMKEILQSGAPKEINNLKSFFPTDMISNITPKNSVNCASRVPLLDNSQRRQLNIASKNPQKFYARNVKPTFNLTVNSQFKKANDLSFSFLRNQNSNKNHAAKKFGQYLESFQRTFQTTGSTGRKNNMYESHMETDECRLSTLSTNDFNPQFASTPKSRIRHGLNDFSRYGNQSSNNNTIRSVQKSLKNYKVKRQLEKKKMAKESERRKVDKEIKHKSFSGRFFDAINTSCTTLVKTVKNIFRPKSNLQRTENNPDSDSLNKTSNRDAHSCSYSFTEYMNRRDAALEDNYSSNKSGGGVVDMKSKTNVEDFSMEMSNSCNTCNNTIALKRKLLRDEHLKQTVRKLKLGINLYGCNFKKISRTMWPKENYMTPAVLYKLYRKLITKKY